MSEEYPLYPSLSKEAAEEAQLLINNFKKDLEKAAKEALSNLYCDIAYYIESDSWANFRNQIMDGFRNYNNRKIQAKWDFKEIRQEIFKEFRAEIVQDLNQDLVEENKDLKAQIERLHESLRHERNRI